MECGNVGVNGEPVFVFVGDGFLSNHFKGHTQDDVSQFLPACVDVLLSECCGVGEEWAPLVSPLTQQRGKVGLEDVPWNVTA